VGSPALDTALQMGPQWGRAEGEETLPRPAAHTPLNASQETTGLLGSQGTLLAHNFSLPQLRTPGSPQARVSAPRAPKLWLQARCRRAGWSPSKLVAWWSWLRRTK